MRFRRQLFSQHHLYDIAGTEGLFVDAIKENLTFHIQHCPAYAELLHSRGFQPAQLRTIEDLQRIPPLPTLFLKKHALFSVPHNKLIFKATSSGTQGVASLVGMDYQTALQAFKMVWRTFSYYKLLSLQPVNYIILGYEPSKDNRMGAAQTAYGTTLAAPALHREYALKKEGGSYRLNLSNILDALRRYERQGFPVRFMGFPAYLLFLLETLEQEGIRLKLHPKSMIFTAGGWKQFFAQKTDRQVLYEKAKQYLDIGQNRCKDFYGAVEHPISYCSCSNHRFHVPVYSRVLIRDATTLEPVGYDTPGIINLVTPLMGSMPFCSILTDDIAVLHPGKSCGCGIDSPWFEILGRAGLEDIKTCAAGAAQLLEAMDI